MARVRKSTLSFDAITLEGSLLSSAKFAAIAERKDRKADEQEDADYSIPKGLTLRDETARYFRIGQALFRELHASSTPSRHKTIEFTDQLLRGVFGFSDIQVVRTPKFRDDRLFPVTLEALGGRVPVVVVPPSDGLDHASNSLSQDRRRSAASALQDWLNADDAALWGLCTNGESLRLLRDNESLTRPAYLEADLRQIFEAEDYAGFSALWLVLHASRFGNPTALPGDCPMERWRESGSKAGITARDRLSKNVEDALIALGTGFLAHSANAELTARLREGILPIDEYFRQLLRLVYRLIFLLAAEDRNLLHLPAASEGQRKLYAEGYSLGALRDRAIRRSGWDNFHDRWSGLSVTFRSLANGQPRLGLPALGGIFASTAMPELDRAQLSNRFLMEAIFRLAWLRDDGLLMPVNWRDMETEELGSVYESLLELTPRLSSDGHGFLFADGLQTKGNARKTSGSYYTPDSLVQVLLDSALDPVLDRIESESEDPSKGLLEATVIDPACGSGHFLLAAARRIAKRVVRLRCGDIHTEQDRIRALRDVVRSCIYGVDRNPMAVELAKVALWIETIEPGKPLGFLDANIRCGDSLLGILHLKALQEGIPDAAYKPLIGDDKATANDFSQRNSRDKGEAAGILDFSGKTPQPFALPPLAASLRSVRALPEDTVEQVEAKRSRFASATADRNLVNLAQAADLYIAAFLTPKTEEQSLDLHNSTIPTTEDVWKAVRGSTVYGPRLGNARQLAVHARAFHWPLEFADVMSAGGFDVVLGNPPWEKLRIQEQEFFASREPAIAEAQNAAARGRLIQQLKKASRGTRDRALYEDFELAKRIAEASSEFARVAQDVGGRFPLTGQGDINTYALFAELMTTLHRPEGQAGIVVPTGVATNKGTSDFFIDLVTKSKLISLTAFDEIKNWFAGAKDNQSFCLLTIGRASGPPTFIFNISDIAQLSDARRKFTLTYDELRLLNANTMTTAVFQSHADAEVTRNIYTRIPILVDEAGGTSGNQWSVSFMRMFDMANDSGLFRTAAQLRECGYEHVGTDWLAPIKETAPTEGPPSYSPGRDEALGATEDRYVPLYEAKMMHQFDHRFGFYPDGETDDTRALPRPLSEQKQDPNYEVRPRYWLPDTAVESRRGGDWDGPWNFGYRFVTNPTNERTIIAAAIPRSATPHVFPQIIPGSRITRQQAVILLANLNTLVLDYVCRQKMSRQGLDIFILKQLPVIPPSYYDRAGHEFVLSHVLELTYTSFSMTPFARELGYEGPVFAWDEDRRSLLRAELDAWYARAYGLTRDELRYILDPADVMGADYPSETFRVLKEKEIKLHKDYSTQRLTLGAWDRMEMGELSKPEPYQRPALGTSKASHSVSNSPGTKNQPSFQFAEADPE